MTVIPEKEDETRPDANVRDQDLHKGAVEGDRPKSPEPVPPALDENGMPRNQTAIAQDVIGANEDETQG
jgi:hypothetical protein